MYKRQTLFWKECQYKNKNTNVQVIKSKGKNKVFKFLSLVFVLLGIALRHLAKPRVLGSNAVCLFLYYFTQSFVLFCFQDMV